MNLSSAAGSAGVSKVFRSFVRLEVESETDWRRATAAAAAAAAGAAGRLAGLSGWRRVRRSLQFERRFLQFERRFLQLERRFLQFIRRSFRSGCGEMPDRRAISSKPRRLLRTFAGWAADRGGRLPMEEPT